ncbi:16S rRNA (cytosine(1402)-N(4))-methyltransferase RsmH [Buchnera aphidicola]|uniref:Ribosomal RNA small subunit methyltransferase H n=1 Tax=Buchnera aphidicola subsp. Melaphis rhois TaxID=118103 RepID=A0A4D6Y2W3_BUCMH|nr:16S rRNA (cytosine(1402)-N(4))-methyltransferase RsmH [Buchnera aphidicola]QCI23239.1 16S rRNA (cytosine(1402)-N(4))-methyltransferase RsmH [Buchnera aphidicola (Melaphis rhois)]
MNNIHLNHIPVLTKEVIKSLNIKKNGTYIDCTFGFGGHSKKILEHLNDRGTLYAIDKDPYSINIAKKICDNRFHIIPGNFSKILKNFQRNNTKKIDGILLDLGMSSMQLNNPNRGFSFLLNGPLDMRMNPKVGIKASEWLMKSDVKSITKVLYEFGEERFAKKIAIKIVQQNKIKPITTTIELSNLIKKIVPKNKKHPATRTFQAIRIHINQELNELREVLKYALKILTYKGRLSVISFHSLEDRIVKKFILKNSKPPFIPTGIGINEIQLSNLKQITLKIIDKVIPTKIEINTNPRARSAILRISEKKNINEQ